MARVNPGTPSWGDDLNADLDGIEATAQAASTVAGAAQTVAAAALAAATVVDFTPSMAGYSFMAGSTLPDVETVPTNTIFFLLPEA